MTLHKGVLCQIQWHKNCCCYVHNNSLGVKLSLYAQKHDWCKSFPLGIKAKLVILCQSMYNQKHCKSTGTESCHMAKMISSFLLFCSDGQIFHNSFHTKQQDSRGLTALSSGIEHGAVTLPEMGIKYWGCMGFLDQFILQPQNIISQM